ncbi:MAG: ribbon-helix-helix domain-containing protein [Limnohabitans sp.]
MARRTVTIPKAVDLALAELAATEGRSVSNLAAALLEEGIRQRQATYAGSGLNSAEAAAAAVRLAPKNPAVWQPPTRASSLPAA